MKRIDFSNVDITMPEDMESTREDWLSWFDEENEAAFAPYQEQLTKLRTIVGFGRGFWAGVHGYSYIVYHTEANKFYWFLRDIESDFDVFFYEINENDIIFSLLSRHPIQQHFSVYDEALDYEALYYLSKGQWENLSEEQRERYVSADLAELFGEDTKALRIALMEFKPGSWGTHYPHDEYDKKVLTPILGEELQQKALAYNNGAFHVFAKNKAMYVTLGEDTFELVETKKKEKGEV